MLRGAAGLGLAAATGLLLPACGSGRENDDEAAAEEEKPPETTTIRLLSIPEASCIAAGYMAEPFLREEGFTDIQYPSFPPGPKAVGAYANGEFDIGMGYAATLIRLIEKGSPLMMLGGVHVGCWKIFARGEVKSVRDFNGKTVSVIGPEFTDGMFMAITLAEVGLDIKKDVKVVNHPPAENPRLLSSGEVDAVVAFPPGTADLEAKGIGHVVLNSLTDPPWSNYYCCSVLAHRDWMNQHPVAAKRALRAVLKGADAVAGDPDGAARSLVDRGFTTNFDYTCEILRELPYDIWREFDQLDSIRFYALRLKQAGLIESTPDEVIEQGTDFRYLAELKGELREA
jgi:NitT/TauT family transport system substrate-binding protein